MELYLHSAIHLHGVVLNLGTEYIFLSWYLVKHRAKFTFTFTFYCGQYELEVQFWVQILAKDSQFQML